MTDEIVYKTVRLPVASSPDDIESTWTAEEVEAHEARVQAHMARVHPMLDAIRREEARVYLQTGDRVERDLRNNRRWKKNWRAARRGA